MKRITYIFLFISVAVFAQPEFSSINSQVGAFSRLGFGARGMGMGNAMSAVKFGNLVSYYNPALSVFQKDGAFQASYGALSLDRKLNFINFTKSFSLPTKIKTKKNKLKAGISFGILNAGVGDIVGRDNQGNSTGTFSTTENQFFVAIAKEFSEKLAFGVAIKFYHYSLFKDISSSGTGFDLGAIYSFNKELTFSFVISDINSKYNFNTVPLLQQNGSQTENKFPLLKKIGISYNSKKYSSLISTELEVSNAGTTIFRIGIEHYMMKNLTLRGGIDNVNLRNSDFAVNPSLGVSFIKPLGKMVLNVNYAFIIERFSSSDRHIIGITLGL